MSLMIELGDYWRSFKALCGLEQDVKDGESKAFDGKGPKIMQQVLKSL